MKPFEPYAPPTVVDRAPSVRIGGWLLFFCVWEGVLLPGMLLVRFASEFVSYSPKFVRYPALEVTYWSTLALGFATAVLTMVTAHRLYTRKPGAVQLAKVTIFTQLVGSIVNGMIPLTLLSYQPAARILVTSDWATGIFVNLGFFAIWFTYFHRSRRVAATFPDSGIELPSATE